ncbi:MAG: outer membrane lipoprotein-sorting protein [Pseudomonadota bacterium]
MNKVPFLLLLLLALPCPARADLSAREIIDKSILLDAGHSVLAEARMIQTKPNGKLRSRTMRLRRKTDGEAELTRLDFTAPADIKGLSLLIVQRPGGEADQYLYTPALRRVRRIRGSLKGQEFADTDFSYEDMERKHADDSDYSLDGEEALDGRPCWKITATTKKRVRSQYGRTVSWIDKETFLFRRIDLYDRGGTKIITIRSLGSELILGIWTQTKLEMDNLQKGTKTAYENLSIRYDGPLDSSLFTVSALGQ